MEFTSTNINSIAMEGKEGTPIDQIEMMFRWGDGWVSIVVVPVTDDFNNKYFVVKMQDLVIVIRLNQDEEWEELKEGETELARHLGKAIEEYYAVNA